MTDVMFVRCNECRALNEPRAAFCSRCGASLRGPLHGATGPSSRRLSSASLATGAALLLGLLILVVVLYTVVARSLDTQENVGAYTDQEGIPATIITVQTETTAVTDQAGATATSVAPGEDTGSSDSTTTTVPSLIVRPKATVSSSALKGTSTASYQATNLLDDDLTTAWVEGANGTGLGEWVRFEFAQPLVLARLEIANGFQKDDQRFRGNPRVRLVKVEYSSGATQLVELFDVKDLQMVVPTSEAVEWVRLIVVSVYPGERWEDAALSEVHLYEKAD
jgi:hypothetical protein